MSGDDNDEVSVLLVRSSDRYMDGHLQRSRRCQQASLILVLLSLGVAVTICIKIGLIPIYGDPPSSVDRFLWMSEILIRMAWVSLAIGYLITDYSNDDVGDDHSQNGEEEEEEEDDDEEEQA